MKYQAPKMPKIAAKPAKKFMATKPKTVKMAATSKKGLTPAKAKTRGKC